MCCLKMTYILSTFYMAGGAGIRPAPSRVASRPVQFPGARKLPGGTSVSLLSSSLARARARRMLSLSACVCVCV
jgi:hypothetical protein